MIGLLKPRGFWDYTVFALAITGLSILLFWLQDSNGFRKADAMFALVVGATLAFASFVFRRGETAKWISRPKWGTKALIAFGVMGWFYLVLYGDAYLFHRSRITSARLREDVVAALIWIAVILWYSVQTPRQS